jgi:hypothetical protein
LFHLISFAIAQDMTPLSAPDTPSPPRLLDQVRERLRTKYYFHPLGKSICLLDK